MRTIFRSWGGVRQFASSRLGSSLSNSFRSNQFKNALRVESPELEWTFKDLERHAKACAYGLVNLGFEEGDKIGVWLDKGHPAEALILQLGAARAGVTLVPCRADQEQSLGDFIKSNQVSGLVVAPNAKHQNRKRADILNKLLPQINGIHSGSPLDLRDYPSLRFIINTGFYTLPGTIKFRNILLYANPNFTTEELPQVADSNVLFETSSGKVTHEQVLKLNGELNQKLGVQSTDTIILAGDVSSPAAFALGGVNSAVNGNFLIYDGHLDLTKASKYFSRQNAALLYLDGHVASSLVSQKIDSKAFAGIKQVVVGSSDKINTSELSSALGVSVTRVDA